MDTKKLRAMMGQAEATTGAAHDLLFAVHEIALAGTLDAVRADPAKWIDEYSALFSPPCGPVSC